MKNLFYPSSISATVMLLLLIVLSPAMSSAACIGPPVINYFTATPNPVQGGPDGMLGPSHNVQLSWNISNADGIRLVADSGESGETTWLSPVINGMQLLLSKTHTFTLYARNEWIRLF